MRPDLELVGQVQQLTPTIEALVTPDIDGALVGGASLKAADFLAIVAAFA